MDRPRPAARPVVVLTAFAGVAALTGCVSDPADRWTLTQNERETATTAEAGAPESRRSPVLDPFANAGPERRPGEAWVLPTSNTEAAPVAGFGRFGVAPNTAASAENRAPVYANTENIQQISFASEGADFDPTVDRDGERVFFASTRHRATADIYVQSIYGTAVTQLTTDPAHDVMPAVSPDGERIAFASNRNGSWDIYVMNASGGPAVQITSEVSQELHPSWSPDGRFLTYCRLGENSDRWEIWVADLGEPANRTFLTYGLFPEWSPVSDRIVFQRSRERGARYFSIWTVEFVDGEAVSPTEIASSSTAAIINPSWSPDGRFLACATVVVPDSEVSMGRPEFADVWMLSADGSARTNLTGGWFVNTMPTWGPDGRLFFISDRSGVDTIWSVDPTQAVRAAGMEPPRSTDFAGAADTDTD